MPFDYIIKKIEYSEEYVVVHCISPTQQSRDRLFFYSVAEFQEYANPFPAHSWSGGELYNETSENVALFTFVTSNTMLIRSTFDYDSPIYLYQLGSTRIKVQSFESQKLSKCSIQVNNYYSQTAITFNLSELVQSKEELAADAEAKFEQKIDWSVFFLFLGPPSIIMVYLSWTTEEWLKAESPANSREGTNAFEEYPMLAEERKRHSLDDSIGEEGPLKEEEEEPLK